MTPARSSTAIALVALALGAAALVGVLATRGLDARRERDAAERARELAAYKAEVEEAHRREAAAIRAVYDGGLHPGQSESGPSGASRTARIDGGAGGRSSSPGPSIATSASSGSAGAAGAAASSSPGGAGAAGSSSGAPTIPRGALIPRHTDAARQGLGGAVGRVVRAEGDDEGVPGVRVAWGHGKNAVATETDEAGAFRLELQPGVRSLVFSAPRRGAAIRRLQIVAGQDADAGAVALEAFGRVEGTVRDARAQPLAGVRIEARVGDGERREVLSDGRGAFALEDLPADQYFLDAHTDPESAFAALVRPGETVRVVIGGVPQIAGTLRGPLGAPPRDRSVVVVSATIGAGGPEAGADVLRAFAEAQGRSIPTDAAGRFEIGGLAAGRYLVGKSSCYEEVEVPALPSSVPAGETIFTPVEVDLQPGVIEARLVPAAGEPDLDASVTIHAVREAMLESGLAGDGRALLLATLSEDARDLAPPGGAACLVPQAGSYLLLARGGVVSSEAVRVEVPRAGRAQAVLPVRRASGGLVLSGFPAGAIALAVVRDRARRIVAVETFSIRTRIALAAGTYDVRAVQASTGLVNANFSVSGGEDVEFTFDDLMRVNNPPK